MDKRRVLLLRVQPLLGKGLEHILGGLEDAELIEAIRGLPLDPPEDSAGG